MNQKIILKETNNVRDAVRVLEESNVRSVVILDDNKVLKGLFTEGDLRRFILQNGEMDCLLAHAMNREPQTFLPSSDTISGKVCPIVNESGQLIDVINNNREIIIPNIQKEECLKEIPLVIMAGGLGTRLYPLTKILPKALIPIGEYTITERIINNFTAWGCKDVYIILNHKADMVKAYFNEKEKDYNIYYIQEEEFLGTGGGLALLKGIIKSTFILSNCDILVEADYDCILKTHYENKEDFTFIGAYKNVGIPYGVLHTNEMGEIQSIQEKPEISFLTNTGVYVIEPTILETMVPNKFCHITDLAMESKSNGKKIGVFPITEQSWQDMGQIEEMKSMIKSLEAQG